jgi:hypothetical protein
MKRHRKDPPGGAAKKKANEDRANKKASSSMSFMFSPFMPTTGDDVFVFFEQTGYAQAQTEDRFPVPVQQKNDGGGPCLQLKH